MSTRNHLIVSAIGAIGVALSGCAAIATHGGGDTPGTVGIPYLLPKTLFEITLAGSRENITLEVRPFHVGDPAAGQLTLSHRLSPLSSDTITFTPDARGLLTSLNARMDSRAAEAFGRFGTISGQFQGGEVTEYIIRLVVDPTDPNDLGEASSRMTAAIRDWTEAGGCEDARGRFCAMGAASFALNWTWEAGVTSPRATPTPSARGPGYVSGVYVRAPRPGRLNVWRCTDGGSCSPTASGAILAGTLHINIPNGAPPSLIPLNGGLFADRTHDLRLVDGMVARYRLTGQSEAEGLGTAAVGFLAAQVQAASEALQSDISRTRAEATLVQEQTNLVQQQAGLARALRDPQEVEVEAQGANEAAGAETIPEDDHRRPAPGQLPNEQEEEAAAEPPASEAAGGIEGAQAVSIHPASTATRSWSVNLFPAAPTDD